MENGKNALSKKKANVDILFIFCIFTANTLRKSSALYFLVIYSTPRIGRRVSDIGHRIYSGGPLAFGRTARLWVEIYVWQQLPDACNNILSDIRCWTPGWRRHFKAWIDLDIRLILPRKTGLILLSWWHLVFVSSKMQLWQTSRKQGNRCVVYLFVLLGNKVQKRIDETTSGIETTFPVINPQV